MQNELDQLHDDVVNAYNDAKSKVDALASDVDEHNRDIYDKAKADLASIEADLEAHKDLPAAEAKRGYRSIQHLLRHIRVDIRYIDHDDDDDSASHDVHHALTDIQNRIDHILDRL